MRRALLRQRRASQAAYAAQSRTPTASRLSSWLGACMRKEEKAALSDASSAGRSVAAQSAKIAARSALGQKCDLPKAAAIASPAALA